MKSYKKSIAVLLVLCGVMISLNTSAQKKKTAIRPIAKAAPQKKEVAKPTDFKVNVKWPDGDGKFVLLTTNRNGLPVTLDSVSVVNGAATLQMPAPDLYATVYLGVNGNYFTDLLLEVKVHYAEADSVVLEREFFKSYDALINAMPKSQQMIYRMRYHDHLSTADIAAQLNISRKTVQNQLTRAVALLRASLLSIAVLITHCR